MMMSNRVALFIVGPPGAGKTTIARELLGKVTDIIPKPKWSLSDNKCAVGHYVGNVFDGGDTVPYNGVKDCLNYWCKNLYDRELTIFDGDRFSTRNVIEFLQTQHNLSIKIAHISAPERILEDRRKKRGSNQNPTWIKGRVTKAKNFSYLADNICMYNMSTSDMLREISDFLFR